MDPCFFIAREINGLENVGVNVLEPVPSAAQIISHGLVKDTVRILFKPFKAFVDLGQEAFGPVSLLGGGKKQDFWAEDQGGRG